MIDLFQRNFDTDAKAPPPSDRAAAQEAEAQLKQQLEEARQQGFDAGRRIGRKDAEAAFQAQAAEQMSVARDEIRTKILDLTADDALAGQAMERDIVELFCGIAERLVPEFLDTYGIDLAISQIRQSISQARTDPVLEIRACPDVIGVLEHETPEWLAPENGGAVIRLQPDTGMNPGAVHVHWQGGRLEHDLHATCTAMLQALAQAADEFENRG